MSKHVLRNVVRAVCLLNKTLQTNAESHSYTIDGKTFIVTPVYKEKNGENLNDVLLKLMCCDNKKTCK